MQDDQMFRRWLEEVDHSRVRYVFLASGREVVCTGTFSVEDGTATWKSMGGEVVMQADAIVGVELLEPRPEVKPKPVIRKKRLRSAA